jgi:hypothetical protein
MKIKPYRATPLLHQLNKYAVAGIIFTLVIRGRLQNAKYEFRAFSRPQFPTPIIVTAHFVFTTYTAQFQPRVPKTSIRHNPNNYKFFIV